MTDDFDLPMQLEDDYDKAAPEITNSNELQSQSVSSLQVAPIQQPVTDEQLDYLNLQDLERAMLKAELSDSEMYLKNIHKGFKFAKSTRSLINLVGAGLAVHKHRRQIMKDLKENKKQPFEIDEYGNVKY